MKRFLIPPIALIGLIVILLVACGSAEFSSDESVLTQNMSDEKLADSRARGASAERFPRRSGSRFRAGALPVSRAGPGAAATAPPARPAG